MCKTCLNKLASYLNFRNQCLEANRILNIAIFQGSDCLHNEEVNYSVNFTEAETECSDCEEESTPVYNQNTADLFNHLIPQSKRQSTEINSSFLKKKIKLEIIDQLNDSNVKNNLNKSEIKIISDVTLESSSTDELEMIEIPQEEDLTVGLELEVRSDSPTRKKIVEQTKTNSELFTIEPANINLNYDCEKDSSVFTISDDQNDTNHDSDSGITTESSGCTVITSEDPTSYFKRKNRHKCSFCGVLTNDLTNHLLTHQNNRTSKIIHSQDHEIETDPVFPCSMCERTFATDSSLRCHFASHTREKKFICPVCAKSCAYKYTLSSHMRIHGIYQEIYSCDICDKTFRKK